MHRSGFTLPDALQAGISHLSTALAPLLRRHWLPILLAAVLLTVLGRMLLGMQAETAFRGLQNRGPSFSTAISTLLLSVVGFAVNFGLVCYIVTAAYAAASPSGSRGWAWRWGSAEPPLLGITTEQALLARSAFRRLLSLWPGLIFALLWGVKVAVDMQIDLRFGNATPQQSIARTLLFVLSAVFLLWYFQRLARNYLFRAPVIVETGTADEAAIAAWMPEGFPRCLRSAAYWNCTVLMLAAFAPIWVLRWLLGKLYDGLDLWPSDALPMFVTNVMAFFAWAVMSVLLAGALRQAWSAATPAADPAPQTPASETPAQG
ncbi:MAG: hypothetical protein H5U17_00265 [Defluviimonas sp.]|nr:hypothetical protein [Defluviimonas sp.]